MRRGNFNIVLDACVLAPANLCDLFLRLAETPRLYTPFWSSRILDEVTRTQVNQLRWPKGLAAHWRQEVETHFPEALVAGYEPLLPACTNDAKDRHVVAAAVHAHAETIVTFNLKDFPEDSLAPFGIRATHPSEYLNTLCSIDGGIVVSRLEAIARKRGRSIEKLLESLSKVVPGFVEHVNRELGP